MRFLGSTFIILSSLLIGVKQVFSKRQNIQELKAAVVFLAQLKSELQFTLKSPPELLESAFETESFFIKDRTCLHMNEGESFKFAYLMALDEDAELSESDKMKLSDLGSFLGIYDRDTQLERLDLLIADLKKYISAKEAELLNKEKLYMIFSVSAGMGLVIILL